MKGLSGDLPVDRGARGLLVDAVCKELGRRDGGGAKLLPMAQWSAIERAVGRGRMRKGVGMRRRAAGVTERGGVWEVSGHLSGWDAPARCGGGGAWFGARDKGDFRGRAEADTCRIVGEAKGEGVVSRESHDVVSRA